MTSNTINANSEERKVPEIGSTEVKAPLESVALWYLLNCIKKKKRKKVENALHLGPSSLINQTNKIGGHCALHIATLNNDLEMAHLLLSRNAHPDIRDKMGRTAMMMAAELGNVNMVEILARYQGKANLVDKEGKGLLFYCLRSKNAQARLVNIALEMGADVNNISDKGESVFLFACREAKKYEKICLKMLEKGANLNIIDQDTGNTPLILAAKANSVTLVRELLLRGANPNAVNKLQQHSAHFAAFNGSIEVLRILSEYSADLTMITIYGETPIHLAGAEGHAECYNFLYKMGSCLTSNQKDFTSSEGLERAAEKEVKVATLRDQRSHPSFEAIYAMSFNRTYLDRIQEEETTRNKLQDAASCSFYVPQNVSNEISDCIKTDNFAKLKTMLEYYSVDFRDHYYKTPLMVACINGKCHMAKFFIENKADVNAYDYLKWTSLHHACFKGHANIVMLLLKHGASVDALTLYGVTPLMRAIMCCRFKCVKVLLEAGASINTSNKHDCTLLAKLYGGTQICDLVKHEVERRKEERQRQEERNKCLSSTSSA